MKYCFPEGRWKFNSDFSETSLLQRQSKHCPSLRSLTLQLSCNYNKIITKKADFKGVVQVKVVRSKGKENIIL